MRLIPGRWTCGARADDTADAPCMMRRVPGIAPPDHPAQED